LTSISSILVQFRSDANTKDTMRDLRDKVDSVKSSLPTDVNTPVVAEISLDDTPVWIFSIS
jgi:multidrug efflux pump subunit AcrB